jgi:Putative Flp pilus-assembly TadE/G-like
MNIVRNNRGVVLVFVAMGLLLFLLFLGLALDTGWLVYVRAQGQARIDSAALAAAAALIEPIPTSERGNRAIELANTFGDKNSVVNSTVNPENVVTPMTYDETDESLREAESWELWSGSSPVCNAVRVTASVPTPVFFAGIRNVFGAGETGQENLTFSSVSHLPCPGLKLNEEKMAPFALPNCSWIASGNFRNRCNRPGEPGEVVFDLISEPEQATEKLAKREVSSTQAPIQIDSSIQLSQLKKQDFFEDEEEEALRYACSPGDGTAYIVPVVDQCTVVGEEISGTVIGFASICLTVDEDVTAVRAKLQCGEVAPNSAGTGECFGTYASNPILIR